MYRPRFSSPLFTEGPHVLCPSPRRAGPARRAVVRVPQGLHRTRPLRHRRIAGHQARRPTLRTDRVPIFAISSIAWVPRPSRPLPSSGKKGVPRFQHDLPPLPGSRAVQGLSQQGPALGPRAADHRTCLLPLPPLPPRPLPRRRRLRPGHGRPDLRRGRVDQLGGDLGQLRPGRRGDPAQDERTLDRRIDRGADDRSDRLRTGPSRGGESRLR